MLGSTHVNLVPSRPRRRREHRLAALVATIATVTALAACSSSSGSSAAQRSSGSTTSGASAKSALDPNLVKLIPATYKSNGVVVAPLAYSPPFTYVDTNGHVTKGLAVDVLDELQRRTGLKVQISNKLFAAIPPGIQAGRYDVSMPVGDFTKRHADFDIVDTTLVYIGYLVPTNGSFQPKVIEDFCGKTLAAQAGAFSVTTIDFVSKVCQAAGKPAAKALTLPDSSDEVLAVKSGRADAVTDESDVINAEALASHGTMKLVVPTDIKRLQYGTTITGTLVAKKSGLGPLLLAFYRDMAKDGTYQRLYKKWGESLGALKPEQIKINGSPYQS